MKSQSRAPYRDGPILAVVLLLLALVAVAVAAYSLRDFRRPEVVLTLELILGVIVLLTTIAALLALLQRFGLENPRQPLGLPSGSIRAILALGLMLIFALVSVYLYSDVASGITRATNVTAAEVAMLPQDRIVEVRAAADGQHFDVDLSGRSANAEALAQQLVTLLGTLVTAVVSFYFAAGSIKSATSRGQPTSSPGVEPEPTPNGGASGGETTIVLEEGRGTQRRSAFNFDDEVEAG